MITLATVNKKQTQDNTQKIKTVWLSYLFQHMARKMDQPHPTESVMSRQVHQGCALIQRSIIICGIEIHTHTHTHTHRFNGLFPGEPGLSGCPLNSPSPFITGLCILLG